MIFDGVVQKALRLAQSAAGGEILKEETTAFCEICKLRISGGFHRIKKTFMPTEVHRRQLTNKIY
jgi:hypothetical protein